MIKNTSVMAGIGLALSLVLCGNAFALAPRLNDRSATVRHLQERQTAAAPLGFLLFCMQEPRQCRGGGASSVTMSAQLMTTLKQVNSAVNRAIRPRNDKGDIWSVNVASGDCEDFALTKRARLIALGVPAGSLRIATGRTRWGEGHAVLVVRTGAGDYVLDNRTSAIKEWHKTDMRWIAMSGSNPQRWHAV